jgi:citrate synthase
MKSGNLKKILQEKIQLWRNDVNELINQYRSINISEITVEQLFKGMRGVPSIVCDTSYVDPHKGLFIRDYHLLELQDKLPEEIFFLLLTGELPNNDSLALLNDDINKRLFVPEYVWDLIENLPDSTHPMVMLSMTMLALHRESVFSKRYENNLKKEEHWEATLEDALDIITKMPIIVAGIYRIKALKKDIIPPDPDLGLACNFVHMLGVRELDETFKKFMRLFMVVHSDHEGGNVAVNTTRIVNSALSDLYYSISAGINGLAGFLHGMANEEMVKYILQLKERYKGVPDDDEIKDFVWGILNKGKISPGFGHAVLRDEDPRFIALYNFGKEHWPNEEVFRIVEKICRIVPEILREQGRAKDPNPNIDAISGAMLYHFGIKEIDYYPAMFATSQVLGICAQLVLSRALLSPIFRPRSITTRQVRDLLNQNKQ